MSTNESTNSKGNPHLLEKGIFMANNITYWQNKNDANLFNEN